MREKMFRFTHAKFEMPVGHPNGDVLSCLMYGSEAEWRGLGDLHLGVMSLRELAVY